MVQQVKQDFLPYYQYNLVMPLLLPTMLPYPLRFIRNQITQDFLTGMIQLSVIIYRIIYYNVKEMS